MQIGDGGEHGPGDGKVEVVADQVVEDPIFELGPVGVHGEAKRAENGYLQEELTSQVRPAGRLGRHGFLPSDSKSRL